MPTPQRHPRQLLYGALIIGALAATAALIVVLDDIRQAFRRTYTIVALFPKADGLNVDSPAWVAGRVVGRVVEITLLPVHYDTVQLVAVSIQLPRRVQAQVRADSYARLTAATLIGERVVDIVPGSPSEPALADGDTLGSRMPRAFAELQERTTEISTALDSLAAAITAVRAPLGARLRALEPVQRELDGARREFAALRRSYEEGPAHAALHDAELRAGVARLSERLSEFGPAFARAAGRTEGAGQEVRDAVGALRLRFAALAADVAALDAQLQDTEGFIGRAARDTAIQVARQATQEELDSLIAAVRRDPFRFLRLRLF